MYSKNIIVGVKKYFHFTVKSIKYTHRMVNTYAKNWDREEPRNV